MKIRTVFRVLLSINRPPFLRESSRSFSQLRSIPQRSSYGIAFDVDGVILRGGTPIGSSVKAFTKLYGDSGSLKIPFLFLTNGGGIPESRRAFELTELLGVIILPSQVVQGHSPFQSLLKRYENELIVAAGKGDPAVVMSEYGFKKVISLDEYSSYFDSIDPVSHYKTWTTKALNQYSRSTKFGPSFDVTSERVRAAFVVSDPVDWGRDIQAAFPCQRLGMGAFRIALQSVFNRIHHSPMEYTSFGKPNPVVFKNAETILRQLQPSSCNGELIVDRENLASHAFETLYMIGDNPSVDIEGARQAGHPWFSILTRTGVFRGKENHAEFPADLVVDTVEDAVEYIMQREGMSCSQ